MPAGRVALPGVLAVLTRDTIKVAANSFGAYVRDQQIIATDKVRYAGDMMAAVAATQPSIAAQALTLIDVDYEELPAVFSIDDALKAGAPLVHEKLERRDPGYGRGGSHIVHDDSNICLHFRHQRGDIAAGFKDADAVFEDTFYFPSAQHYPMEPHVCVAHFEGETLTVWSATQSPFPVRQELARIFALPFSGVRDHRARGGRRLRRQERHQDRRHCRLLVAHVRPAGTLSFWRRRNF